MPQFRAQGDALARHPALSAALLATAGSLAYLVLQPPSGDLAAATYRAQLFAHNGLLLWDNGWYGGHYLLAYSLLMPPLGALLGARTLLALSAPAAAALFGSLAARAYGSRPAALAAALSFALGFCAELTAGRVAFDCGIVPALGALLLLCDCPSVAGACGAAGLAAVSSLTSPLAGLFLALAATATLLAELSSLLDHSAPGRPQAHGASGRCGQGPGLPARLMPAALLIPAALGPSALLSLFFPEGGSEPFAPGAFWPALLASCAFALLLPAGATGARVRRRLRLGAMLYALTLIGSFLIASPVGGNAARLGAIFGPPLAIGALWRPAGGVIAISRRLRLRLALPPRVRARPLLIGLLPALLYWQLATAIHVQDELAGDAALHASFYAPLLSALRRHAAGRWLRVELPMTGAHWEASFLPVGRISLARGWERQLDRRFGSLFYRPALSPGEYRRWLVENAVDYVALPRVRLDSAGQQEARLIAGGLPYLRLVWNAGAWRLYEVLQPGALVQPRAQVLALGHEQLRLRLAAGGGYRIALHYSPYWAIRAGHGCLLEAPGGWTQLRARGAGELTIGFDFSFGRIFASGARCR